MDEFSSTSDFFPYRFVYFILSFKVGSARVRESEISIFPNSRLDIEISRQMRFLRDQGLVIADDSIKKGGFANIGPPDENDEIWKLQIGWSFIHKVLSIIIKKSGADCS